MEFPDDECGNDFCGGDGEFPDPEEPGEERPPAGVGGLKEEFGDGGDGLFDVGGEGEG